MQTAEHGGRATIAVKMKAHKQMDFYYEWQQ